MINNTVDFLPVVIEGEDSGEDVVRERRDGLRGSVEHHGDEFVDVANEEAIRGASEALLREMTLDFHRSPPQ